MKRISKENYYLDIAETVLERATCLRRVYGAIIVKNDEIIATGTPWAARCTWWAGTPEPARSSPTPPPALCAGGL